MRPRVPRGCRRVSPPAPQVMATAVGTVARRSLMRLAARHAAPAPACCAAAAAAGRSRSVLVLFGGARVGGAGVVAVGAALACRPRAALCEARADKEDDKAEASEPEPEPLQIANLAPLTLRCVAALLDGLLLLAGSAVVLFSGLRGKAQSHSDGMDWESFYYVWSHLPTLCTLSTRRNVRKL